MDVRDFLSERLDRSALPIAVGDVLLIAALLTYGVAHHSGFGFVLDNPLHVVETILPFLIGWAVAAPPLGAYSPGAAESAKAAVPLGLRSWIVAALIGTGLRWTPLFTGGFHVTFLAVTLGVGLVVLGLWRFLWFRLR